MIRIPGFGLMLQCRSAADRAPRLCLARPLHGRGRSAGQALVEGIVGLGLLLVLLWAVAWLGRYRDWTDILAHASRHAAFLTAQEVTRPAERQDWLDRFWLADAGVRWRHADGRPALVAGAAAWAERRRDLPDEAQPGGLQAAARGIRPQWRLQDPGLPELEASLKVPFLPRPGMARAEFQLRRHTTLAMDAGASQDDADSTSRLESGGIAWADAARRSRALGQSLTTRLAPLDRPWSRPAPRWDWVASWQDRRPAGMVREEGGP